MKKLYVTYLQLNILKKAEITEERYSVLREDQSISDLTVYPNNLLMEQNYQTKLTGNKNNKNLLHG